MWRSNEMVMNNNSTQNPFAGIMLPVTFAIIASGMIVVAIVTIPLWLPVVIASRLFQRQWLLRKAESCNCPECGVLLGSEAVYAADAAVEAAREKWQKSNPRTRARTVRWLDCICQSCGAPLCYRGSAKRFVRLQTEAHAPATGETMGANNPAGGNTNLSYQ